MDQTLATILKYAIGIIGVGFIVLLHEVGHFIAAHIFKIEVEIFSVGFGPKMIGRKFGHTEYRISWFLFGGYCRMKGADDLTRALDANSKTFVHVEHGSLFATKPINKFLTYLAGPLTNFLITILLCTILISTNHETLSSLAIVSPVDQYPTLFSNSTSPAGDAGIKLNDKILKIDNEEIEDWQQVIEILNENKKPFISLLIERDSKVYNIIVDGEANSDDSFRFGLTNVLTTKISSVNTFSPEKKAGLKKEDLILKINGVPVNNNLDLLAYFEANTKPSSIDFTILRDNKELNIEYIPSFNRDGSLKHNFALYSPTKTIEGLPFNQALDVGYNMALTLFSDTVTSLLTIIRGNKDTSEVRQVFTGPMRASLMIGNITVLGLQNSFTSGLRALCYLLAVVSISLTIANLLPLPSFDGGQMLISLVEIITRKKISPKNYWICQLIGMISVIILFSFMYFIDFKYFYKLFTS
ncbi:MAG: RIP metalloprotease RseP [Sphaerochaetaceae bacterium]|nr:RIP metalloprotease RseP [Sphaerochaetaceae bacterium]MDC7236410.1 RIP metalloprotease RseP [Sphaerochaetaceae bacterium]